MWILKWLPDFVFHLIFLAGLLGLGASFVLKFVPFVAQYRVVIQVAASILIAVGLYMEGAISDNTAWVERVHALEKKVAESEARSADANTQLVSRLAAKQKEIAAVQADAHNRVQQAAAAIDAVCTVPATVISILNDAARSKK
jgi:enamine deaminase RidA (YjgF/YER057c/UK114 family)